MANCFALPRKRRWSRATFRGSDGGAFAPLRLGGNSGGGDGVGAYGETLGVSVKAKPERATFRELLGVAAETTPEGAPFRGGGGGVSGGCLSGLV